MRSLIRPLPEIWRSMAAPDDVVVAAEPSWQRIRLTRCFAWLMVPVGVVVVLSGGLWLGVHFSDSGTERYDAIHFWFVHFDVGRERNVSTWFNAGLWIAAGALAGYFARRASRQRRSWLLFSAVCVFLSIDETLELHERLDVYGNELSRYLPFELGFTWVIPGVLITAGIVGVLVRMVVSLPRDVRFGIVAAGVVFLAGGVGFESLSGRAIEDDGGLPWQFFLLTLIEESFEMTGVALCVAALAHLIAYRHLPEGATAYRVADGPLLVERPGHPAGTTNGTPVRS